MANQGNGGSARGVALDRVAVCVRQDLDSLGSVRVDRDRLGSNYVHRNDIANSRGRQGQYDGSVGSNVIDDGAVDILRREGSARGVGDNPGSATYRADGDLNHIGRRQPSCAVRK